MSETITALTAPTIHYIGYKISSTTGKKKLTTSTWTNIDSVSSDGKTVTKNDETLILSLTEGDGVTKTPAIVYFTTPYTSVDYLTQITAYAAATLKDPEAAKKEFMGLVQYPDQSKANTLYTFNGKSPCLSEADVAFYFSSKISAYSEYVTSNGQLDTALLYFDGTPLPLTTNSTGEYNLITCATWYRGQWSTENKAHIKIVD